MFFLSFLRTVVCKWLVINVTLITLEIPTKKTRLIESVPIVLMKLIELYVYIQVIVVEIAFFSFF